MVYNRILITAFIAWIASQITKTIIHLILNKEFSWERFFGDAGMPSSHSALVMSLTVMTGIQCGWDSPLFAVTAVFAAVVMHDAVGVRQETGKQARAINNLMKLLESMGRGELTPVETLKELVGHTGRQVAAGALLGILIAVLMNSVLP